MGKILTGPINLEQAVEFGKDVVEKFYEEYSCFKHTKISLWDKKTISKAMGNSNLLPHKDLKEFYKLWNKIKDNDELATKFCFCEKPFAAAINTYGKCNRESKISLNPELKTRVYDISLMEEIINPDEIQDKRKFLFNTWYNEYRDGDSGFLYSEKRSGEKELGFPLNGKSKVGYGKWHKCFIIYRNMQIDKAQQALDSLSPTTICGFVFEF